MRWALAAAGLRRRVRQHCKSPRILSTKPVDKTVIIQASPEPLLRDFYIFVKLLKY
jgi:hypothetical protein